MGAHGEYHSLAPVITTIRRIAKDLDRHIGILGDLAGPKIRLGALIGGTLYVVREGRYGFTPEADPDDPNMLTTTYEGLIDDLAVDHSVLLADGTVALRGTLKA